MNQPFSGGRSKAPGPFKRRPSPPGGTYPSIGQVQFSFQQLIRQAIELRKSALIELMNGDNLEVTFLREDQFTFTVLVQAEIRILYKHAIKSIAFTKE